MAKKTILLLLALCLLGGLSALVYGRDELDETSIDRFPESFVSYMPDIWNCTWGDTFDDIEVPEDLVQNFTEASLREFYAACYNQVWNELDLQNETDYWSWETLDSDYGAPQIVVDLLNVGSFPVQNISIRVWELAVPLKLNPEEYGTLETGRTGRFSGTIPRSLFDSIGTQQLEASIVGIYYGF